jgi:hypothetical protein
MEPTIKEVGNLSTSDYIASWALLFALVSLVWNIVRDLIMDRMHVEFNATYGSGRPVLGTDVFYFNSLDIWDHGRYVLYLTLINKGRRNIYLSGVKGIHNFFKIRHTIYACNE